MIKKTIYKVQGCIILLFLMLLSTPILAVTPLIIIDSPNTTMNYGYLNGNESLNLTLPGSNVSSVWYNYNGTNVSALTEIFDAHGTAMGNTGSYTNKLGMLINTTKRITITKIRTPNPDGVIYIQNANKESLVNSTVINGIATFSYELDANTKYYIMYDNASESYNYNRSATASYPYFGTDINWIAGWNGGDNVTTEVYIISNITSQVSTGSIGTLFILNRLIGNNVTVWANDSAGNLNSTNVSWIYKVLILNETYTTPTTSGTITNFLLQTFTNGLQITLSYLNYNNTNILGTITSINNYYNLSKNQIVTGVSTTTNIPFFWNITLSDGFSFLTKSKNQAVSPIAINATCSPGMYPIFNFTLADEITQASINGTAYQSSVDVDLTLYTLDRTNQLNRFYNEFNVTNPIAICIDNNLSNGAQYSLDIQVKYGALNYSTEYYNLERYVVNSSNLFNNITLYDLDTTNTQNFELIARDSSFLPLENAIIKIDRKYIGNGTFYTVEMPKTDELGITSASLQLNDVIYNFYIYQNGILISSFTNVIAICQNPLVSSCSINFNTYQSEVSVPDYESADDFNFTLTYNSTSRVVLSQFLIPSGTPATVRLEVIREDALGTAICEDELTSSLGTVSCIVPNSFGNSTVLAKLYKDGVEYGRGNIKLDQSPSDIFGVILIFMSVFVLMTLIGIGVSDSPVVTGVFILVGLILLFSMNLVKNTGFIGATATILFIAIAVILVLIKAAKRS